MNTFFPSLLTLLITIISLVFLIEKQYLFEEGQAFSLRLQLLIILIVSVVFLIHPQCLVEE